MKEEYFYFGPA